MNNIKLSIFTGVQDTDIIDLGLYNPSIEGVLSVAYPSGDGSDGPTFSYWANGHVASSVSSNLQKVFDDMNTNPDKYAVFHVADLLAAQDYLNKLKIACDTYPACTVKIETI